VLGVHADFFFEFAARQLFGILDFHLPAALGQLERALLDGVAELLDQPDPAASCLIDIDGQDDRAIVLLYDAVDAALAVGAQDLVFAHAHPVVAVDFAAGERGDAAGLSWFVRHAFQISFSRLKFPGPQPGKQIPGEGRAPIQQFTTIR
jgi:hypothetical protein